MRVPRDLQNCVLTIGVQTPEGVDYGGTAFLVAIAATSRPGHHTYLVTAAHCLEKIGNREYTLRANTTDGHSVEFGKPARWYFHKDGALVDVGVTPFSPPPDTPLSGRYIDEVSFITPQDILEYKIGPGDEVFMTGLFTEVPGASKNLPIVRMGNVALIPDQRIPFGDDMIDAYLIESRSIGGLSGSPAFVSQTLFSPPYQDGERSMGQYWVSGGKTFFLGLVRGHWGFTPNRSLLEMEKVNMGISVVVPAQKIRELLYQPEHIEMRAKSEREQRKARGTASNDSSFTETSFTKSDFESALKKASRHVEPRKA